MITLRAIACAAFLLGLSVAGVVWMILDQGVAR